MGSGLLYSTYLGGSFQDKISSIAVDGYGDAYVAGGSSSSDFPVTPGGLMQTGPFVAELNPTGSALIYSTFLNTGASGSYANASLSAIVVDGTGSAYVAGSSSGSPSPVPTTTPGAYQGPAGTAFVPVNSYAFVAKLQPSGTALAYAALLGPGIASGLAIDASGNAYVTGATDSAAFPTTAGTFQEVLRSTDAPSFVMPSVFVTKLNSQGSGLVYSTFIGESAYGFGSPYPGPVIAVDPVGNAYVAGTIGPSDFPTVNPLQASPNGPFVRLFVSKLDQTGSSLLFSTLLGGTGGDTLQAMSLDLAGDIYLTGSTMSSDFPVVGGVQTSLGGAGAHAFLAKISSENPIPELTGVAPSSALVGAGDVTLVATGSNFGGSSVLRWNGSDRETTFLGSTQISVDITAADLATLGTAVLTVFNPAPSGGLSNPLNFNVVSPLGPNPTPQLFSISPVRLTAGSPSTVSVTGGGFVSVSRVLWNGADKPTTFLSETELRAEISVYDLAATGTATVTVFTPAPGGGTSTALTVEISANPVPSITSISPTTLPLGVPGVTLVLNGQGFTPASAVRWNGMDRPTTYVSNSGQLRATIPPSDLAAPDIAEVRVLNSNPGGGGSPPQIVPVYLSLSAEYLIYDKTRQKIYASVSGGDRANTITTIDPGTGALGPSIPVGDNPGKLAMSDDGQYLYVALDGSASVRQLDLNTQSAVFEFSLGKTSTNQPRYAVDLKVLPGSPQTVAVLWSNSPNPGSSGFSGLSIFDSGVKRPKEIPDSDFLSSLETSTSASALYGFNFEGTIFRFSVDSSGVSLQDKLNFILGPDVNVKFDNDLLYGTDGKVIDALSGALVGTYPVPSAFSVAPDSSIGRTFFVTATDGGTKILSFDQRTFLPLASLDLPIISDLSIAIPGYPVGLGLVRWGDDGLAFPTADSRVFLIRAGLVAPPSLSTGGVVNAASFAGPVAPGSIASLFGPRLAFSNYAANGLPLPTSLGRASLMLGGQAVPLIFASPYQINFQVPWELAGQSLATMILSIDGGTSNSISVNLGTAPGIFTAGGSQGVVVIANTATLAAPAGAGSRPANHGEIVTIYGTGLGPVTNAPATGSPASTNPLSTTTAVPVVRIGGELANVSFSGLSPGFVGLYQIDVQVPDDVPSGDAIPLNLTLGGVSANSVTIAVAGN